mgnify:CR=1 FL=1
MGREGTQDRAEGAHALAQVGAKRWRADINGRQDAVLMLASINLPGGEQRRRSTRSPKLVLSDRRKKRPRSNEKRE